MAIHESKALRRTPAFSLHCCVYFSVLSALLQSVSIPNMRTDIKSVTGGTHEFTPYIRELCILSGSHGDTCGADIAVSAFLVGNDSPSACWADFGFMLHVHGSNSIMFWIAVLVFKTSILNLIDSLDANICVCGCFCVDFKTLTTGGCTEICHAPFEVDEKDANRTVLISMLLYSVEQNQSQRTEI